MLTRNDLDQIEQLVERKISHLPTKDEFYTQMDRIMGELQAIRQEQILLMPRLADHEDRITILEKIHPSGQHTPV